MNTLPSADGATAAARLARRVARAIGGFESRLLRRTPRSVTVVGDGDRLVVSLHESLSPLECRLAADSGGRLRVEEFHRGIFADTHDDLLHAVWRSTGVVLDAGLVHVDGPTGSVLKTFTTAPSVELVLLGQGLPALGVPVNAHLHAHGASGGGVGRS